MNLDDARDLWRSQKDEPIMTETEILNMVARQSADFERRIRRRDRIETVTAVLVCLVFLSLLTHPSWMTRGGVVLFVAASALMYLKLRRARREGEAADPARPLSEVLRAERRGVEAQIRLLETVLWWYIAPLATGVVLIFAGTSGSRTATLVYTAVVAVLAAVIYGLNQQAVRRELRPRRDELARLLERIED